VDDGAAAAGATAVPVAAGLQSAPARPAFVLCPALEAHHQELAKIVGFALDPKEPFAAMGLECIVRSGRVGFARVTQVTPGLTVAMRAQSIDAAASPAPELGPDAMFVAGKLQPHVVFTMGPVVIDVDAENIETPSRETMIALATRVRDILAEANR
jgi:hypothetical protein